MVSTKSGERMDLLNPEYTEADRELLESMRSRLNVAHEIFDARVALGLTQAELGKEAGTKQSRVSELEAMKGNVRFDTLDRIARVLGLMVTLTAREAPAKVESNYELAGYPDLWASVAQRATGTGSPEGQSRISGVMVMGTRNG